MAPEIMGFGILTFLVISFVGVTARTTCSVPCSRPNGFNPNLLNATVICPLREEQSTFDIALVKRILQDLKSLSKQSKDILVQRLQKNDLSGSPGVILPDVQPLLSTNNLTLLQNKLQEHMLIYNVFIEYIQWSQQCLFKLEGQINTIYSHLNLMRSAVMTLVCVCWDGKPQLANNINIDYRDLQSKYMENRIAYFGMRTLNNYTNSVIQKINSLQS